MLNKTTLIAAVTFAALAAPAQADVIPGSRFAYDNWKGSAYTDQNGFSHCAISASYRSGISLHFAIDRKYKWRIGFSNPKWNMTKGEFFAIRYRIDRHPIISAQAKVISPTFAMAELRATNRIFNQFRRGRTLRVEAGSNVYPFSLRGTSRALKTVLGCVNTYIDYGPPARVSRPMQGEKRPASPARTASDPVISTDPRDLLAATRFAVNLFSANEYAGHKLLKQEALTGAKASAFMKKAAVAWQGGNATGMLHVLNADAVTPTEALAKMIANDAKHCKDNYASGTRKSEHDDRIHTAFTACRAAKGYRFYVDYIVFPRGGDKLYLISNIQANKAEVDQSQAETFSRNVAYVIN